MKKSRSFQDRRSGLSANVHRMHTYMNRAIKVPQKGKIRVFLVMLFIIAAGKNVLSFVLDSVTPTREEQLANMAKKESKRAEKEEKRKLKKAKLFHVNQLPKSNKAKGLSYTELQLSIVEHPPTFSQSCDTVQWKNGQIIRYYSLDTNLQKIGNKLMKTNHPKHAGMVVLQPRSGRVLALISYNNPKDQKFTDNIFLNAQLPAASIFKTITAAAAIEKSAMSGNVVMPITGNPHTLYKNQIAKNLRASYTMTFSDAFAYSVNPIFGRIGLYYSGIGSLQEYANKFGFNDTIPFELPVGISSFKPETDTFAIAELASGYNKKTTLSPILGALIAGGIAHGGKVIRPTLVDSVKELATGNKIYEMEQRPWRVIMSEKGAATLKGLMQATTAKGTARKGFATIKGTRAFDSFQHGGKTGNINADGNTVKGRIEWFIGFLKNPELADEDLSCAIVQVHGATWNVHSSYLAGEMLRHGIKGIQERKKEILEEKKAIADSSSVQKDSTKSTVTQKPIL